MSENQKHVRRARQMVAAGALEVRYGREYDPDTVRGLLARIDELDAAIRRHRDNADQAWTRLLAPHPSDVELWAVIGDE